MGDSLHETQLVFGPIASRRFGRSLGVNNIPAKHCSYSCVYCQVGATPRSEIVPREFYPLADVVGAVEERVRACRSLAEPIDVISFVPAGEPTLDANLGDEIVAVKAHGIPVAVITNGSLLWMEQVRQNVSHADIVSIEVDSVDEQTWRRMDRPSPELSLARVHDGIRTFARSYGGELVTQTMLLRGLNDDDASLDRTASFIAELAPRRVCLSVPTRPPADDRASGPDEETVLRAAVIFANRTPNVELLGTSVNDVLVAAGDETGDLVAALSVHPMREEALLRDGVTPAVIDRAIEAGLIARVSHAGSVFLTRRAG